MASRRVHDFNSISLELLSRNNCIKLGWTIDSTVTTVSCDSTIMTIISAV